jgi:hypothetical protein
MTVSLILALRVLFLALTLWGSYILLAKLIHRVSASAFNVAWPSSTGALFAATMGWLS